MRDELHYRIALTLIPQVGDVVAKELLRRFGTARDIFTAQKKLLESIPGVGTQRAAAIRAFNAFHLADAEIAFMGKNGVQPLFYTDPLYPRRLQHCYDSPVMLYAKGHMDLQAEKILGVVGTRTPTAYGHAICEQFIAAFAAHHITIVSGMAYGIDITAHKAALAQGLPTVGVLAHGLDKLYPAAHYHAAQQMLENGGLLTDFCSGTKLGKQNFPRRNRIVAGLCDATLVIESGIKGGSLITADIACGYNRDVMAVPGRIGDARSAGCLELVRHNKAALVTGPEDVLEMLNWRPAAPKNAAPVVQSRLFNQLGPGQQQVVAVLGGGNHMHIDEIQYRSGIPQQQIPGVLLQLEMEGLVRAMPGNTYQLIHT
ncbi:DNA-processing protein DprA [Chitinophaga alhagiae]|uniref:DNA-processing protein DprA n=1 Tax=Chitinophaga alhagiae TaxID=2203219 RepID=UPI000E5A7FB7|nr:DNA-processing protein DprA [Chitinophaga alhagiae]